MGDFGKSETVFQFPLNFVVSVLTSTGPFWVSSVAFWGADPGFKEATGLCSGLEAADPTICHFGRDLAACSWSVTDGAVTVKDSNQNELCRLNKLFYIEEEQKLSRLAFFLTAQK